MGNESILNDLCILKVKILEVFEELMVYDGFSDGHQVKLCEAFSLLEESLCLLSDVKAEIKNETFLGSVDKETFTTDTETTKTQEVVQTEEREYAASRKRAHSEKEQEGENIIDSGPPIKRSRGRPRKLSTTDVATVLEQSQSVSNREKSEPEVAESVTEKLTKKERIGDSTVTDEKWVVNGKDSRGTIDTFDLTNEDVKTDQLEESVVLHVIVPVNKTSKRKGRGRPKKETSESEIKFKGTCITVLS